MLTARRVLRTHRAGITLTYALTAIENLFELLYPFAIGLAINGLMQQSWVSMAPLLLIWLAHTASGYLRQRYDTRLFTRIYTDIAAATVVQQRGEGELTSEIAARTDMAEELVEFMEDDIPAALLAAFSLIGGALMLLGYDGLAGALMIALLVPATAIYVAFGRAALRMEGRFNNRSEREVGVIHRASARGVRRHFRHLSRWRVRISDAQARSWSSLEMISMAVFAAVLVRLTQVEGLLAGDIFAAVSYAVLMLGALDALPDHVASISRTVDNLRRLD